MQEIWKAVPGYFGHYEVSNHGNVRSIDKLVNFWLGQRMVKGRNLIDWVLPCGYKCVALCRDGGKSSQYVHRLVASAFIDKYDESLVVNHKDGNKLNNHVENLEWISQSANLVHALRTGLRNSQKGEASVHAKLKESDVLQIRDMANNGVEHIDIARMFNISYSLVSSIKNRRCWRHI